MSANKYVKHVLVLPEDDANTEIANGFVIHHEIKQTAIRVLPCAGGWEKVLNNFLSDHVVDMENNKRRHMVLLIDFDKRENRYEKMVKDIPDKIKERVFVIGVWSEPEKLPRRTLGSREEIGMKQASECFNETRNVWDHDLLRHNANELSRMTTILRPILFPSE